MRIAALQALLAPVAAATRGEFGALVATAQPHTTAGQLTPAASHPTPPVSGVRPVSDFDIAEPSSPTVPSATPVVCALPPATSVPPPAQARGTVAAASVLIDGQTRGQVNLRLVIALCLGEIAAFAGLLRPLRSS